jgi:hypothetical protein
MSDTLLVLNSLVSRGLIITDIANCIRELSANLAAKHYTLRIAPLYDIKNRNRNIEKIFLNLISSHDWVEIESIMHKDQKMIVFLSEYKNGWPGFAGNMSELLLCAYEDVNHATIINAFNILIKIIGREKVKIQLYDVAYESINGDMLSLMKNGKGVPNICLTKYILDIMLDQGTDAEKDKLRDLISNTGVFGQMSLRMHTYDARYKYMKTLDSLQALLATYLE